MLQSTTAINVTGIVFTVLIMTLYVLNVMIKRKSSPSSPSSLIFGSSSAILGGTSLPNGLHLGLNFLDPLVFTLIGNEFYVFIAALLLAALGVIGLLFLIRGFSGRSIFRKSYSIFCMLCIVFLGFGAFSLLSLLVSGEAKASPDQQVYLTGGGILIFFFSVFSIMQTLSAPDVLSHNENEGLVRQIEDLLSGKLF